MSTEEISKKIIEILEERTGESHVLLSQTFSSLSVDSLDCVEIVMAVEEEFRIEVTDDEFEKSKPEDTIMNLVTFVENRLKGRAQEEPAKMVISMADAIEKKRVGGGVEWRPVYDKTYTEFPDRQVIVRVEQDGACGDSSFAFRNVIFACRASQIVDGMVDDYRVVLQGKPLHSKVVNWVFVD